jgi:hypothetical protein
VTIDIRRGSFRLWIVFAVLFVIAVGVESSGGIREEFNKASLTKEMTGFTPLVPVDCSKARGYVSSDYEKRDGRCWYEIPKFRALHAEYKDLNDYDLSERLYKKAGIPLKPIRPWTKVTEAAGLAVGVPLAVLMLGWSLIWAFSGFRRIEL